jgi:hypothetical protein
VHLLPAHRQGERNPKKQIEKVRRVHSGDGDDDPELLEVFDLAIHSYVLYGTASNPEMIEVNEDEEILLEIIEDEEMSLDG